MYPARSNKFRIARIVVAMAGAAVATPASAQSDGNPWVNGLGGLLGGLINQAIIDNAVKSWNAVDPDVQGCLVRSYNIVPADLAQQGISAKDSRLSGYMQSCQQAVAQARQTAAAREAAARSWNAIDPDVLQCLTNSYSFVPAQLMQQGIGADDPQIANQMIACREAIAQKQKQVEEQQHAMEAAHEAEEKAAKERAEARHKDLVAKFGKEKTDAIENGRVTVGMSKDAVREALGAPNNVESIPPDDEMWVYGSERIAISNGKVTYVGR